MIIMSNTSVMTPIYFEPTERVVDNRHGQDLQIL
uniref:Uncharacterized protein n=1 Tax=Lepeophtheirus salmonis TaxID=72036 RepID=A0A0K2UW86_LEPSM